MLQLLMNKALYKPMEDVIVSFTVTPQVILEKYEYEIFDLHQKIQTGYGFVSNTEQLEQWHVVTLPSLQGSGAYGLKMIVTDTDHKQWSAEIAFDFAKHWREVPRYGFLTDFGPQEKDHGDIVYMQRNHINIIQFYDWMYRHDQLLPDVEDIFVEPLGRTISLQMVKQKIDLMKAVGIDAIAYAAVYASLKDYAEKHPQQLLYNNAGEPYQLGEYYYIMDITSGSAWEQHIVKEFEKVIHWGFDGLHLDQYGFPKKAIRKVDNKVEHVQLKDCYPTFIEACRTAMPEAGLIFNNVSGYPVHTTAGSNQEIIYIEVWDPVMEYGQLKQMIDHARQSSNKQTVLAAYLPTFQKKSDTPIVQAEYGALVTMAAIFASGGYHLLLGENNSVLADSYYPNYGCVSVEFSRKIEKYYDFIVMYRELLFDLQLEDISMTFAGGINTEIVFTCEEIIFTPIAKKNAVWNIVKEKSGFTVIQLVNLCGLDNIIWYEGKQNAPTSLSNITIKVEMLEEVEGVYWASPDGDSILPNELEIHWEQKGEHQGNYLVFTVPMLHYWDVIYIRTKANQAILKCETVK